MARHMTTFALVRPQPTTAEPTVRIADVSHVYGEGATAKQVLYNLNLTVERGEIVILMGPSGCGKTTVLTLVGGLRSPQSGSVRTLGRELNGADGATQIAVRRRIGFIYQAHNLHASMTAFENVRMGLEVQGVGALRQSEQRCAEMLASVGLADKLDAYPAKLSGGQKQRVAIARSLVSRPDLILADEPTSALDKDTGRQIVLVLQDLAKRRGSAILMVTHDNRILDIADRILEMEDGRIIGESRSRGRQT